MEQFGGLSFTLIFMSVCGFLVHIIRQIYLRSLIKIEFMGDGNSYIVIAMMDYLENKSKHSLDRRRTSLYSTYGNGRMTTFKTLVYGYNTIITKDNKIIVVHKSRETDSNVSVFTTAEIPCFYSITFFGIGANKLYNEMNHYIEEYIDNAELLNTMKVWTTNGTKKSLPVLQTKTFNSIFFPKKEELIHFLDMFKARNELFKDKEENTNCGILLHGVPGTGKSSIIKAISNYLELQITYIPSDVINDSNNKSYLNVEIINNSLVVLEDIDSALKTREDSGFNDLMQRLDGLLSTTNTLFIMTTNNKDKIDNALFRSGRVDLSLEIAPMTEKEVRQMIEWFDLEYETITSLESFKEKFKDGTITGADLRNIILKYTMNNSRF